MTTINACGYLRFSEEKLLEKFRDGELSFSCAGKFISDEMCTGDKARGDRLEAVFARVRENDKRIEECKKSLGQDLEVIHDTDGYVFLRRRSSCLVPIFCMFCITENDFKKVSEDEHNVKIQFCFPEKMYRGFSDNGAYCSVFAQAKSFDEAVKKCFEGNGIEYKQKNVNYSEKRKKEFFIIPDDSRSELFYKSPNYDEQNEVRIILPYEKMKSICERKNFQLSIPNGEIILFPERVGMTIVGRK